MMANLSYIKPEPCSRLPVNAKSDACVSICTTEGCSFLYKEGRTFVLLVLLLLYLSLCKIQSHGIQGQ